MKASLIYLTLRILCLYIYIYTYKLCEHVHVDNADTKEKMFARYQNM